jgi:hypothetical protein
MESHTMVAAGTSLRDLGVSGVCFSTSASIGQESVFQMSLPSRQPSAVRFQTPTFLPSTLVVWPPCPGASMVNRPISRAASP